MSPNKMLEIILLWEELLSFTFHIRKCPRIRNNERDWFIRIDYIFIYVYMLFDY